MTAETTDSNKSNKKKSEGNSLLRQQISGLKSSPERFQQSVQF